MTGNSPAMSRAVVYSLVLIHSITAHGEETRAAMSNYSPCCNLLRFFIEQNPKPF